MINSHPISVSSSELIDARLEEHQLCASKQCPGCGHKFERRQDWLGLPAGVKFDPTDQELIEHLEAKVQAECTKAHPMIDEFIPTIEGEDGICYTHPEKLPGVTKDGLSRHFFHRPSKAYTTGTRKRRKIQAECDIQGGETRWHKTGKTRPVMVNGKQKGCKKILVLYTNFGKHRKPEKTNWVMHQYHLGVHEEEKEGELVVSKIFYQTQPRQSSWERITAGESVESRRDSGGGSSSSREIVQRDEVTAAGTSNFSSMDLHKIRSSKLNFASFRKSHVERSFEEPCGDGEGSTRTFEDQEERHSLRHETHTRAIQSIGAANFHLGTSLNPISAIGASQLHPSQLAVEDPYHVSRMMLHNEKLQGTEQQQPHLHHDHHLKLADRPTGLEELIMSCTSAGMRQHDPPLPNPQDMWLKYSFWPDTDSAGPHE